MMSSSAWRRPARLATGLLLLWACAQGEAVLGGGLEPPGTLIATPLNLSSVRLEWQLPGGADLQLFRIERRSNLSGSFEAVAEIPATSSVYFDTGLEPATFYGYRVVTISRLGERSPPSVVAGAQTPPLPGIRLETSLLQTDPSLADPNGYRVRLQGPRDTTVAVGSVDSRLVAPLPVGSYTLTLADVAPTCTITGGLTRSLVLADTGLVTQQPAAFSATCADPSRGTLVASVRVTGDSVDPDGYRLDYAGILTGDPTPVTGGGTVQGGGQDLTFPSLRPGDYEVSLGDVEAPCAVAGPASRNAQVTPLGLDTLVFTVTCPDRGGSNPNAPFLMRNVWSPGQAAPGQTVTLDISLDLSAVPGQDVGAVQAELQYDPTVLTLASSASPSAQMGNLTVNGSTPGRVIWLNFSTAATAPIGVVPVARFTFSVTGSNAQVAATRSTIQTIADFLGSETLEDRFRVVEDTFTVGSGGGGGGNLPPIAQAGGPYSGAVGAAIRFSSAGSADPDGTIASYSWSFGDGSTGSQANPSKSYAAPGTYTVTLTVTDNQGATATDQASVIVTGGGGGGAQPFTFRNVFTPQVATVGQTVTLDITLDASAQPAQDVGAVQAVTRFDPAVLQYVGGSSPAPQQMNNLTVSTGTPGQVSWLNFTTAATPPTGAVAAARFTFTVIGTGSSATQTSIATIANAAGTILLDTLFRVVDDTFSTGGVGGNQAPTAQAGGPYSGTAGGAISFSSAGSGDPDGTIVSYAWGFGDGSTSAQANPTKSYAAAGSYTVSLTVTDNQGAIATDQAAVTVAAASSPITWTSAFGAFEPVLGTYPLVISLNLTQDIPQTAGPEALQSYAVDSLVWNPAVLEYHSLTYASGGGSVNPTDATGGCRCKLIFTGAGLFPNSGDVAIATVRFRPKGASGGSTQPRFHLGTVLSTPALGSFNYLGVLQRMEGTITLP